MSALISIIKKDRLEKNLGSWFAPYAIRELMRKETAGPAEVADAIFLATRYGEGSIVQALVEETLSKKIRGINVMSAIYEASSQGREDVVRFLTGRAVKISEWFWEVNQRD